MDAQRIFEKLNEQVISDGIRVCTEENVESTNKTVKQMAIDGEKEGLIFVASSQTAGRGRRDHSFFSPADSGVYMSILVQPKVETKESIFLMPMAAIAVAEAIEEVSGKKAKIKWVNDVYLDEKKASGILVEGVYCSEKSGLSVVIGIGINVFEPYGGFPDDIKDRATSVFTDEEKKRSDETREQLVAAVVNHFFAYYQEYDSEKVIAEYADRSCVIGRKINVFGNGTEFEAIAKSIDNRGRLIVEDEHGKRHVLENDDISIRPIGE